MTVVRSRPCRAPFPAVPVVSALAAAASDLSGMRRGGATAPAAHPVPGRRGAMLVPLLALTAALWGAMGTAPARAQAPAPAPAASAAPGEAWSTERSRRDADKVLQWIKLHADLPRGRAKDDRAATPKRPADAETARAAKPAAPAPTPGSATAGAPAAAASPGPAVATAPAPAAATTPRAAEAVTPPAATAAASVRPEAQAAGAAATVAAAPMAVPAPAVMPARAAAPAPEPVDDTPEALVPLEQSPPNFQRRLMEQLRKGNVEVRLTVAPDGQVSDVQVLNSTHPRLQAPVVAAVRQWRFKPLRAPQSASVELGFDIDREL